MKIAYFSDSYLPYTSGVVTSMTSFAQGLEKRGHELYIYAPAYPKEQRKSPFSLFWGNDEPQPDETESDLTPKPVEGEEDERVVRIPSLPFPAYPGLRFALPHPFVDYHCLEGVDVIHLHSAFAMGVVGISEARTLGAALVFTAHSIYEDYFNYYPVAPQVLRRFTRQYTTTFCNACHCVVAPSRYVHDRLREMGITTRIEIIPTGIDLARYENLDRSAWREAHQISPEQKVLIYVGRLAKEKNIELILRAFARIASAEPNCLLLLAGDGPDRQHLEDEVGSLGIQSQVQFLGRLDPQEVVSAYNGSDLFLFASTMETQGLTILEAMAGRLPVIAVDAPASSEMVDDGVSGYLVTADEDAMADKALVLLRDRSRRETMGKWARYYAEQLSEERMVERMEELYASLAASAPVDVRVGQS